MNVYKHRWCKAIHGAIREASMSVADYETIIDSLNKIDKEISRTMRSCVTCKWNMVEKAEQCVGCALPLTELRHWTPEAGEGEK